MKKIAIFASGSGSNAQRIMEHFKKSKVAEVCMVLTNNPEAYVLQRADNFEIPTHIFDKEEFYQTDHILKLLKSKEVSIIVLAGFLWLIPDYLLQAYPKRIINIHPSLLPKYGGKGMYGKKVHEEVLKNHDSESGITIHYVNEHFDEGEIIYQARFRIEAEDDLEMIIYKGQHLEHLHYPRIVENLLKKLN